MVGRFTTVLDLEGVAGVRDGAGVAVLTLCWRTGTGLRSSGRASTAGSSTGEGEATASSTTADCSGDGSFGSGTASAFGDASGVGNDGLGGTSCAGDASDSTCFTSSPFSGWNCLGLGGHSRFSFTSSLAASPPFPESALGVRGGADVTDCRFVCCSNLPMRFATL